MFALSVLQMQMRYGMETEECRNRMYGGRMTQKTGLILAAIESTTRY